MARFRQKATGTVADGTLTIANAVTIVGTGPVLGDNSPATHADYADGTAGQVFVRYDSLPKPPPPNVKIKVALSTTYGTGTCPELRLTQGGYGIWAQWLTGYPVVLGSDGWLVATLDVFDPGGLTFASSSSLAINNVNTNTGGKVYEAAVIFEWTGDAPPCRIFPRADGIGVGGGRNYPPAKSQQRSSRGVGYY